MYVDLQSSIKKEAVFFLLQFIMQNSQAYPSVKSFSLSFQYGTNYNLASHEYLLWAKKIKIKQYLLAVISIQNNVHETSTLNMFQQREKRECIFK
jgi:hypothetical protein